MLRPGGVFVTTVDQDASHDVTSDIDAAFAPYLAPSPSDATDRVIGYGAGCGLDVVGSAVFRGHGQGRTPASAALGVRDGYFASRLDLLRETDATVEAVARKVGYSQAFAFSTAFKRVRGVGPQDYRNGRELPERQQNLPVT